MRRNAALPSARPRERIIDGLGVSLGIAIGPAHVMEAGSVDIPEYTVDEDKLPAELERFKDAVAKSQRQLRKLKTKSADLPGAAAEELGFLLDAHLQMLTGSRVVRGVEKRIAETRVNAEAAVQAEITEVANSFAAARGRLSRGARRRHPRSRRPPDPQPDQERPTRRSRSCRRAASSSPRS